MRPSHYYLALLLAIVVDCTGALQLPSALHKVRLNSLQGILQAAANAANAATSNKSLNASPSSTKHPSSVHIPSPEWIGHSHLQFTFDMLQGLFMHSLDVKSGHLESVTFSPFSIQSILMMLHLGAKGTTKADIARVLHLKMGDNNQTFTKSHADFGEAVSSLLKDSQVAQSLHSANQIFVQQGLSISPSFSLALSQYHKTPIEYVNFEQDAYQVLERINGWIEKHTQRMIVNFLTSPPSPMTSLMAVNAIKFKVSSSIHVHFKSYLACPFQGDWQYKFDPSDTEPDAWFRLFNGQRSQVEMMVGQHPVAYAHSNQLESSIIELPFKTPRLGFFFLLPDKPFGLFTLLSQLNSTVFANLIVSMRKMNHVPASSSVSSTGTVNVKQSSTPSSQASQPIPGGVNIRLPKFSISSYPHITDVLKNQLGLKSLFSHEDANLGAMFNPNQGSGVNIHMDELLHKAIIKIDEQGSVGAAVSSSSMERVGTFTGPYFEADHPFAFMLIDKQTGLTLFAGVYAGPPNQGQPEQSTKANGGQTLPMNMNNVAGNSNGDSKSKTTGKLATSKF